MSLGLPVNFLGDLPRQTVLSLLKGVDLVILPSYTETFGIVIFEALAAGVPVVAFRVGGIPEAISEGYDGILCDNPKQFAQACNRVLSDSKLSGDFVKYGRNKLKKYFTLESMIDKIDGTYRKIE